jgi:hypothetical protein
MVSSPNACSAVPCTTFAADTRQLRSCEHGVRPESQGQERLVRLSEALAAEAGRARRWRYTWTAINGLSTVAPLAITPLVDRASWVDLVVGSLASALSTGVTVGWPLRVEQAESTLNDISLVPPCERLPALHVFAVSASHEEAARRAWPWHVLNLGVSAALGAGLAFGFHHRTAGFVTGVSGFLAGEAQLLTQPAGLPDEPQLRTGWPFVFPMWRGVAEDGGFLGAVVLWRLR